MEYDLIIIGAGTAGLSASIYAVRAGLKTICIESFVHGGQIINTPDIVNYPAIEIISGADFANQLYTHATSLGADVVYEQIKDIDLGNDIKKITTNEKTYTSKAVIIANGAKHRELECIGEEDFKGKGVSYCATCDGNFYKDKIVVVVGGGNTALQDALYLTKLAKEVHLIHRREEFRGNNLTAENLKNNKNVTFHLNKRVVEIKGNDNVEEVIVEDTQTKNKESIKVDGIFVAIGLKPDNENFSKWVDLDEFGYIISDEDCKTKTSGVFVAGDTRTKSVRQLITAAADGAVSATKAIEYIMSN